MGFQEFGIHFCAVPVMRANVLAGVSGGLGFRSLFDVGRRLSLKCLVSSGVRN